MGSDSEQFKNPVPTVALAAPGSQPQADGDTLASIGYEAADPSLLSPQWREALQGLSDRRSRS